MTYRAVAVGFCGESCGIFEGLEYAQYMGRCGMSKSKEVYLLCDLIPPCNRYDEGTAFLPVVSKKSQVPVHEKYKFMALDEDGYDLPPDWYSLYSTNCSSFFS